MVADSGGHKLTDRVVKIKTGGGVVSCRMIQHGSLPTLMLIHGWSTSKKFWYPFVQELSCTYNLILPDVPNFGESRIYGDYSFDNCAEAVANAFSPMKIDYLLGHSMGTIIALLMLRKQRISPQKIILSNPVIDGGTALAPRAALFSVFPLRAFIYFFYRFDLGRFLISEDYKHISKISPEAAFDMKNQSYDALISSLLAIKATKLGPIVSSLNVPCKVILNDMDPVVSKRHNESLRSSIDSVVLPGPVHCPMYSSKQTFFDIVNSFFR